MLPESAALEPPVPRPAVWPWYVAYCLLAGFLYLLLTIVIAIPAFLSDEEWAMREAGTDPLIMRLMFGVVALVCLALCVAFVAAPFLPRRPWAWVYGIIIICMSLVSGCLPIGIPLLLFWLKQDLQLYFGRNTRTID